ncbi:MAG: DUF4349 domain-containing protein [Dehalococcoidia bacterium]|nr:DUF4349 domain-containing protein [Dehalococcoidia bacterium]
MKSKVFTGVLFLLSVSLVLLVACSAATTMYSTGSPSDEDMLRKNLGLSTPGTGSSSPQSYPAPEITLEIPAGAPAPRITVPAPVVTTPSTTYPAPATTSPPVVITASPTGQSSSATIQRMIVRTGNLVMVVEDISAAMEQISQLANTLDGYVVSSSKAGKGDIVSGVISIRVPQEMFDSAMKTLRAFAINVTSDNTTSQDVSEEYSDLSAKLKNLEATEAQLQEIMKKAEKVEDVLAVQRQLTSTRDEIERTKGRMQYLEQTSQTSLITIQLEQAKLTVQLVAGTRIARADDTIGFRVQTTGGILPFSYRWDFGDGNTSVDASPWHTYTKSGKYTVSVTVSDDRGGKAEDKREEYINVLPGWNAADVSRGAWRGLVGFGRFVFAVLIWLVYFSPVWIIGGLVAFFIIRRRRAKRAAATTKTEG